MRWRAPMTTDIAALYRFNQARADYARSIGQMEKVYAK